MLVILGHGPCITGFHCIDAVHKPGVFFLFSQEDNGFVQKSDEGIQTKR